MSPTDTAPMVADLSCITTIPIMLTRGGRGCSSHSMALVIIEEEKEVVVQRPEVMIEDHHDDDG